MSIPAIEPSGFVPYVAPQVDLPVPDRTPAATGTSFSDLVLDGLDRLEALQDRSSALSVQAATGDLEDLHDYTLAATEASVATQMTVALRNKAVEAFTEIMRMPV